MKDVLLEIKNLHVQYVTDTDIVKALNGVDLKLRKGESLGLVGETGAGKTTTALSIMQLIPYPPGITVEGEILYKGKDIIYNTAKENENMRGNGISMIFQDPMTALNPVMTILSQLSEIVINHKKLSNAEAEKASIEILELVGVNKERCNDYPHQFSGGMRQRVVIAMALLCRPEILIADEPTTALDVTIQAQVLEIIKGLIGKLQMSLLLITHDLGVVAESCDNVAIMYSGQIVEYGSVYDVYTNPKHNYTRSLFNSMPRLDSESTRLVPIEGNAPNPANLPKGCFFHPRCKYRKDICVEKEPPFIGDTHKYKCHFPQ
jgi:peptide/nickel transport system ATP-binding protein